MAMAFHCMLTLMCHGMLAFIITIPAFYHDWHGYKIHCAQQLSPMQLFDHFPTWCHIGSDQKLFSLYAYVQRKHWNVGVFRYFELKQVPNFILALPVLSLSVYLVVEWIKISWSRHKDNVIQSHMLSNGAFHKMEFYFRNLCLWAFFALSSSSRGRPNAASFPSICKLSVRLFGQTFLSHYAILAGFAFVGTFLAHVQISTRLICSSCPAFYWYVSALINRCKVDAKIHGKKKLRGLVEERFLDGPLFIYSYFALYNILGVVMHVNWLPWT